jgi:hypothetical protein
MLAMRLNGRWDHRPHPSVQVCAQEFIHKFFCKICLRFFEYLLEPNLRRKYRDERIPDEVFRSVKKFGVADRVS